MRIDTLLREEIRSELEELGKMEVGSDEYRTTVDGLTKLVDRVVEIEKSEAELEEKIESRKIDTELRLRAAKDERINRIVSHGLNVIGIAVPAALAVWGTKASFEFEKEGTISTILGRGWINKLLPKTR